jgi:predicted dehydrogenase/threonine dehydrogenase-like Zn-dependent dehydrogenase
MRQLALYQDGRLELQDVPDAVAPSGGILVRTTHSVLSPGTERMKLEQARMNLVQKAAARPDQVRAVVDTARRLGWSAAVAKVRNRLESPSPLGYSAAGIVEAVDPGNTRFRVGDRVACGGAESAHHAELIGVPDLLAAPVPPGVPLWSAAYTTLCSIALHAVRQAGTAVGDQAMVVGQGLVGQLVTSLLAAAGARVIGVDTLPARLAIAGQMGAERVAAPGDLRGGALILEWTGGRGVDAVFLCVGGASTAPVEQAVEALRDRGTLVIVGAYDAVLEWKSLYRKEVQVRYARSYGPGRYDPAYEWRGADYPLGYVRWTEARNFEACLHLMDAGRLNLGPVSGTRVRVEDALSVYRDLLDPAGGMIGALLEYPPAESATPAPSPASDLPPAAPPRGAPAALDVIGAGNFARTMLLPHLKGRIPLGTVVNATGLSARHVQSKFGFAAATTDSRRLLESVSANPILIATRHHLHGPMVVSALEHGRHVFVEKPLCLTRDELDAIDAALLGSTGSVMVGFNRRYAPATADLARALRACPGPKALSCHVVAAPPAAESWYANVEESGGRILGESCHFLDLFLHVLQARPCAVSAQPLGSGTGTTARSLDSVAAQVEFDDGSTAQLVYGPEGDPSFPKETVRVVAHGLVAECEDFRRLVLHRKRKRTVSRYRSKGHAEEIERWLAFLGGEAPHPLPYAEARQTMLLTFAVLESIRTRRTVSLTDPRL